MSLPNVFSNMMDLNNFGESYDGLSGFETTMVVDILKCEG